MLPVGPTFVQLSFSPYPKETHHRCLVLKFHFSKGRDMYIDYFLCSLALSLSHSSFLFLSNSVLRLLDISLVRSFVCLLSRSFVRSFVLSFVRAFVRSFVLLIIIYHVSMNSSITFYIATVLKQSRHLRVKLFNNRSTAVLQVK